MGILRARIDVSEGTDPGQAKLLVWVDDTYEPPTFTGCRELGVSNSFGVTLTNAAASAKYGTYRSQLNDMLASIWAELRGLASDGFLCEDTGGTFSSQGVATRIGTPVTVKASGAFGFSTCWFPYDCLNDPDERLYSHFRCRVEAPVEGYNVKPLVAALGSSHSSDPTRMNELKAAVAAHPDGLAKQTGPTNWTLQLLGGPFGTYGSVGLTIQSGTVMRINVSPSFTVGQAWDYNSAPPLGTAANLSITKIGSESPPYNFWPSSGTLPWVVNIIYDEIDTVLSETGGDYPHTYTIVGGPTFGVFDTSGAGTITAGPRILTERDPGTPRPGCIIYWEYRNRTSVGCSTEWQLHVTADHKDSPTKKAPCRVFTETI